MDAITLPSIRRFSTNISTDIFPLQAYTHIFVNRKPLINGCRKGTGPAPYLVRILPSSSPSSLSMTTKNDQSHSREVLSVPHCHHAPKPLVLLPVTSLYPSVGDSFSLSPPKCHRRSDIRGALSHACATSRINSSSSSIYLRPSGIEGVFIYTTHNWMTAFDGTIVIKKSAECPKCV